MSSKCYIGVSMSRMQLIDKTTHSSSGENSRESREVADSLVENGDRAVEELQRGPQRLY